MRPTVLLLTAAACGPAASPPDDLSEPTAWIYGHFDEREDDLSPQLLALSDYVTALPPWAPPERRSYTPDRLTEDHTDDVGTQPLTDAARAVALAAHSTFDTRDHLGTLVLEDQACLSAPSLTPYVRTLIDGEACFGDGLCDDAVSTDQLTWSLEGASVPLELTRQLRVAVLDDGRDVVLSRAWMAAPTPAGALRVTALHTLDVWIPDPADPRNTWRLQATWANLEGLQGDLTPLMLDTLSQTFQASEDSLDGALPCTP